MPSGHGMRTAASDRGRRSSVRSEGATEHGVVGENTTRAKAAMITGLVMLGDRRVTDLLRGSWKLIPERPLRRMLAIAERQETSAAILDFRLAWLESGDATIEDWHNLRDALFSTRTPTAVIEWDREYPAFVGGKGPRATNVRYVPLADFAAGIRTRLCALAVFEPQPPRIPEIFRRWGLPRGKSRGNCSQSR